MVSLSAGSGAASFDSSPGRALRTSPSLCPLLNRVVLPASTLGIAPPELLLSELRLTGGGPCGIVLPGGGAMDSVGVSLGRLLARLLGDLGSLKVSSLFDCGSKQSRSPTSVFGRGYTML